MYVCCTHSGRHGQKNLGKNWKRPSKLSTVRDLSVWKRLGPDNYRKDRQALPHVDLMAAETRGEVETAGRRHSQEQLGETNIWDCWYCSVLVVDVVIIGSRVRQNEHTDLLQDQHARLSPRHLRYSFCITINPATPSTPLAAEAFPSSYFSRPQLYPKGARSSD